MAILQSLSLTSPRFLSPPLSSSFLRNSTFFPKIPFKYPKIMLWVFPSSALKSFPSTEQAILEAVTDSDEKYLPCVRSYENDLARLAIVGAVDFEQALTAAAADGGEASDEHVASGMSAMVVETIYPGPSDEHSTVSTRLFLPARKVKAKAIKLRSSLSEDLLSSTTSTNILAMTFRQVVVQQLWNFKLALFAPGSERNMEDLESPREVPASLTVSSSNERIICALAEAVCIFALESTEKHFVYGSSRGASNGFFDWLSKTKRIASKDSSVIIYIFEDEIVRNAKSLLEKFRRVKSDHRMVKKKRTYHWWTSSVQSKLESVGGSEFSTWTSEYIPAYKLQIDADGLTDVKFEGWEKTMENRWEVLLTHHQMVGLADILDMFFEDIYTLPGKQLSCAMVENPKKLAKNARGSSFVGILSTTLASAIFLVSISVMWQLCLPYRLSNRRQHPPGEYNSLVSSEATVVQPLSLETAKLEAFCIAILKKIKDSYGWDGDIKSEPIVGAWFGELPAYLRNGLEADSSDHDTSAYPLLVAKSEEQKSSALDIASYQVVLSLDGQIVGFQPTSRVAVNHWAANPLAKELYGGKNLSPGLLEPGLKIRKPDGVIVLELFMSLNPDKCFALTRPLR
ncbi:hypothetical protein Nepgr_007321 [Nepenthes gracilis]|uniref:Uncharacterized protein n=1 Tax=Nepenthes gracilis TaxID=150966 RepID=A0AAD3S7E1_NEPGR|nr:hypothetical protein Nepgr_007321 [Nepenthes gracilis]